MNEINEELSASLLLLKFDKMLLESGLENLSTVQYVQLQWDVFFGCNTLIQHQYLFSILFLLALTYTEYTTNKLEKKEWCRGQAHIQSHH